MSPDCQLRSRRFDIIMPGREEAYASHFRRRYHFSLLLMPTRL